MTDSLNTEAKGTANGNLTNKVKIVTLELLGSLGATRTTIIIGYIFSLSGTRIS